MKKHLIKEAKRLQELAGIKTEEFYAPNYIKSKYGEEEAKRIESEIENNWGINGWDRFTSLQSAEEVDAFLSDINGE